MNGQGGEFYRTVQYTREGSSRRRVRRQTLRPTRAAGGESAGEHAWQRAQQAATNDQARRGTPTVIKAT